jgi:1-acyl-sn-glycerol-3-phosphate acyltransferase
MILLRSALFNIAFFAISLVMTLLAMTVRVAAPPRVLDVARLWARCLVGSARIGCGIRLDVRGLEHIPPGAALIASRHQSAFDTFVWLTLLPRCCYVFKRELGRIPLFGPLIGAAGVIFPEGTRREPGSRVVLQSGIAAMALRTGLPVIPVSTDSGQYWGRKAFYKRPGTVRILVGPPIPAHTERKALMRALEDGLAAIDRADQSGEHKSVENSVQSP